MSAVAEDLPKHATSNTDNQMIVIVIILLASLAIAGTVYNGVAARRKKQKSWKDVASQMALDGLLISTSYQARRALLVAEAGDEGAHFFIELDNGDVLYLSGQHLLEYVLDEDEMTAVNTGGHKAVSFPCTDLTLRRDRDKGYLIDLQCRGSAIAVDYAPLPMSESLYSQGLIPEDGGIITDKSYDELMALFDASTS